LNAWRSELRALNLHDVLVRADRQELQPDFRPWKELHAAHSIMEVCRSSQTMITLEVMWTSAPSHRSTLISSLQQHTCRQTDKTKFLWTGPRKAQVSAINLVRETETETIRRSFCHCCKLTPNST
jgi:hypothetical protein